MAEQRDIIDLKGSEYNQTSFIGGMNLLLNDSHLAPNQYRVAFNLRNRYDRLDLIPSSVLDTSAPKGIKQEFITFGNYLILFVAGKAYYKLYTDKNWTQILGFSMDPKAPRYWTVPIPISETNYLRIATTNTITNGTSTGKYASQNGPVQTNTIAGAAAGNLPGLLVQDNINQPQFIFLQNLIPTARTTQTFAQWMIGFTDATNTLVGPSGGGSDFTYDVREYVPIGNVMAFVDGILYIASQDGNSIYRSVSGRPLDFVVNVTNLLINAATTVGGRTAFWMTGGGDATTTAYTVGVGGITALRGMADKSLFVAASNANFSVAKNTTPNAPTIFGEYTFIRTFLFNANCLSDRAIFDSIGDTRFIDLTGVRSFNSIEQTQNEGRNTPFTATISSAFRGLIQDPEFASAILFNDYELYSVTTIFGPAIAVYDTINQDWVAFDINQTNGKRIKILSKIELAVQALFAVTEDDQIYYLYASTTAFDTAELRTLSVCSNIQYIGQNIKVANPKMEVKLSKTRVILDSMTANCSISFTPYVNNRLVVEPANQAANTQTKNIVYESPTVEDDSIYALDDVNTQLKNLLFVTPSCQQGWKVFGVFTWNNGSLTQFSMELTDITPINPLNSQP